MIRAPAAVSVIVESGWHCGCNEGADGEQEVENHQHAEVGERGEEHPVDGAPLSAQVNQARAQRLAAVLHVQRRHARRQHHLHVVRLLQRPLLRRELLRLEAQ